MRSITVEPGLTVTFPGRSEEFDQGVEVGIAAVLMAAGHDFSMWVARDTVIQIEELAAQMRFHVNAAAQHGDATLVQVRPGRPPAKLSLIWSDSHGCSGGEQQTGSSARLPAPSLR